MLLQEVLYDGFLVSLEFVKTEIGFQLIDKPFVVYHVY